MMYLLILVFISSLSFTSAQVCSNEQKKFDFTECDTGGGRWRVEVPVTPDTCQLAQPEPPLRAPDCTLTCKAGNFLDIAGDQTCHQCLPGTFSLGGGELFHDWSKLPHGIEVEKFPRDDDMYIADDKLETYCNETGYVLQGDYLSIFSGEKCGIEFSYLANLKRPGQIEFIYQNDQKRNLFVFEIDSKCQASRADSLSDDPWKVLPTTRGNKWNKHTEDIPAGVSYISLSLYNNNNKDSDDTKPVKLKEIHITGMAYTSSCSPCHPGSFSQAGSGGCSPCPRDTFAPRSGSTQCIPCASDMYALEGSSECLKRPPCGKDDWFSYTTSCDHANMATLQYEWAEPKICRSDVPGGLELPRSGEQVLCPACNVGWYYPRDEKTQQGDEFVELLDNCQPCPVGEYSDGNTPCSPCPVGTAPTTGLYLTRWPQKTWPSFIRMECVADKETQCHSEHSWYSQRDYIQTALKHHISASMVFTIDLEKASSSDLSFTFEMNCEGDCVFRLYILDAAPDLELDSTDVVRIWTGAQTKKNFKYHFECEEPCVVVWEFMKVNFETLRHKKYTELADFESNSMKLYNINITNTSPGGASGCAECLFGAEKDSCVTCPPGFQRSSNKTECDVCSEDLVRPREEEECRSCAAGLLTKDSIHCVSDCSLQANGFTFDFTQLQGARTVNGSKKFLPTGAPYYHTYNISICGTPAAHPCYSTAYYGIKTRTSNALACRATVYPSKKGKTAHTLHSISLGDRLHSVVNSRFPPQDVVPLEQFKLMTWSAASESAQQQTGLNDTHFVFTAPRSKTVSCPEGRVTTVLVRCDVADQDIIELPTNSDSGTNDGCTFFMMWRSRAACPLCRMEDWPEVRGECVLGRQDVFYNPPKHCMLLGAKAGANRHKTSCSIFSFELRVALIVIFCLVLVMAAGLCACQRRNKKLQYTYQKLMESTGAEGELPQAESCGLDEGESDEEGFDRVKFKFGDVFTNKKGVTSRSDGENLLENESVPLPTDGYESALMKDVDKSDI